jgi:nitrite reductase/ring-hydroxylating ferredoxin subunit
MATTDASRQAWVAVARAGEIPPGTTRQVWVQEQAVALVNLDGVLYALDGTCPHRQGPLGEGRLVADELACPWHGFRFDPLTGQATAPAGTFCVPTHRVQVVGDEIQVSVSDGDQG